MSAPIDLKPYYTKLANNTPLSENEAVALLKAVEHFQKAAVYLADCQAATLVSLPKSASKSARNRHALICKTAKELLEGNASGVRYPASIEAVRARCINAVAEHEGVQA